MTAHTTKPTTTTTTATGIPVYYYTRDERMAECRQELDVYEKRYELASEKMADLVDREIIIPSIEVIKWYHLYDELQFLLEMTPTTGTPGTTTKLSTKPISSAIPS